MRITRFFAIIGIVFIAASGRPAPAPQQAPSSAKQSPLPTTPLKSYTRLVTVDVVVTDSHGKPVRDLKKEDFQVIEEHGGNQQIDRFEFIDMAANAAADVAGPPASIHLFSNIMSQQLTIPPTVLLMDSLNTDIANQAEVHRHMVLLLKTLPANTPVAVFVLGHSLGMIQSFSTDPALLRAAVDKTLHSTPIDQNPQDDSNSMSNILLDETGGTETAETQALEDFEAQVYESQVAIRVDETTDAMVEIAKYLAGYSGRKNLIWFSESFPSWIAPSSDFGSDPFGGSAIYTDKINAAAEALTDAQVAVYPADAKGLATEEAFSASQNPPTSQRNLGGGFASQLSRQNSEHQDALASMKAIADSTGGRTCENTNDLSGCVQSALNDGSSYYELSYYPRGVAWDGQFHRITVKNLRHGVKMSYRRGYIAEDLQARLKQQAPDALLQQACSDPLPTTSIPMTVEPISPERTATQSAQSKYLLTIPPGALSFTQAGESRQMNLRLAVCEYNLRGNAYRYAPRDLSGPVSNDLYQSWQTNGMRNMFDYDAKPENQRLRFVVLDEPTGTVGSVDVPAHPRDFGTIPAPVIATSNVYDLSAASSAVTSPHPAPAPAPSAQPVPAPILPAPPVSAPVSSAPSAAAPSGPSNRMVTVKLTFMGSSGKSSVLDWAGDALTYHGDLSMDLGAMGFFQKELGVQFHCQAGSLVPNDANSSTTPNLIFLFQSSKGPGAVVDLTGSEPDYSGDLPVDPNVKPFFDLVARLSHCSQP